VERDLSDPASLLAELRERQAAGRKVTSLLPHILAAVEALTNQRHPDYWVRQRLLLWSQYAGQLESDSRHWDLTDEQWATLERAIQRRSTGG
jgi:hypothetical protein